MQNLKNRTRRFALDTIRFCNTLPNEPAYKVIRYQLLKSGTSVGANYRAACRAQSIAAFIAKLSIVEEEVDETLFWLEILEELAYKNNPNLVALKNEANQLTAITVASKKTARRKQ